MVEWLELEWELLKGNQHLLTAVSMVVCFVLGALALYDLTKSEDDEDTGGFGTGAGS